MGIVVLSLDFLRRFLQKAGPYLLVVLLPGGSVLALLLFLYRRRPRPSGRPNDKAGGVAPAVAVTDRRVMMCRSPSAHSRTPGRSARA